MARKTLFSSVRGRLLALVLVPVLALTIVAGQQARARIHTAEAAATTRDLTTTFLQLGRLRATVELERAAATGTVFTLRSGIDPSVLSLLIGLDPAAAATHYAEENDASLAVLLDRLPHLRATDVDALRAAVAPRQGLAAELAAATPGAVDADLDARVTSAYQATVTGIEHAQYDLRLALTAGSAGSGPDWDQLRAHVQVAEDMVDWAVAISTESRVLTIATTVGPTSAEEVYRFGAARQTELEAMGRLRTSPLALDMQLDTPVHATWDAVRKAASDVAGYTVEGIAENDPFNGARPPVRSAVDPMQALSTGTVAVQVAKAGMDLVDANLSPFDEVAAGATRCADQIAGDAHDAALFSALLLLGSVLVCFGAVVITTRALTLPLQRLAHRAHAIRDGELPDEPLVAGGPSEVGTVAQAMNEMTANLALVAQQAAALGAGRLNDPVLERSVPGRLGASLRSSVTRLSELTDRLARQARRDPMTGLPNRFAIMDRLEEALQRSKRSGSPVGLLFVDIDGFKSVNDAFGHEQGDAVLRVMAERLQSLGVGERLAGRLGADEFVLVVEDLHNDGELLALGEELVGLAQRPVELEGQTYRLSASIGAALSNAGHDASSLLRDANQATEGAKRHGKARVWAFDPAVQHAVERRARVEHDLRRAIVEDEFELFLQPVIETATGRAEGAEGLIRWRLADGSIVPPNDFIPVAEESALIIEIGRLVIAKACRQLALWERTGFGHLHLAINVGGRHVTEGRLVDDIRAALAEYRVQPQNLYLELTESNLVTDLEVAAEVLQELRALGVRIALDDFGTGYSSLTYLRQLPIDTMKLDRSYVNGLGSDEQETSIVRSLMHLADSLDLDVVAEGVETATQLEHLRRLGCRSVQGYLLARPMPPGDFATWLGEHRQAWHDADMFPDLEDPELPEGPVPVGS